MKQPETMDGMTGAGDSLSAEGGDWGMPEPGAAGAEKNEVQLPANLLPAGHVCKPGDKLMFVVTGEPGQDGAVPGHFEYGAATPEDDEDQWAKAVRSEMSPMAKQSEAT